MGYFDRDRNGEKMMKVVIDIPEKAYNATRNRFSEHNMDDIEYLFIEFWIETVRNGTPLDLDGLKSDMKALKCGQPYGLDYLLDCLDKRLGITITGSNKEESK